MDHPERPARMHMDQEMNNYSITMTVTLGAAMVQVLDTDTDEVIAEVTDYSVTEALDFIGRITKELEK